MDIKKKSAEALHFLYYRKILTPRALDIFTKRVCTRYGIAHNIATRIYFT